MELPEYNYEQFASGEDRLFEVEGRLRGHIYTAGRYWDQVIAAIDREHWRTKGNRLLGRVASGGTAP
jgi:hypothetical protein